MSKSTTARMAICAILCLGALVLAGCGGAHSPSHSQFGEVRVTVDWPAEDVRLIPAGAQSVKAEVYEVAAKVGEAVMARPSGQTSTSCTIGDVPPGSATVSVTACPNADGSGTPMASGGTTVTVVAAQTAQVEITMASTIVSVEVTPAGPSTAVGQTVQLAAAAKDSQDRIVLVASGKIQWTSSANSVATVDSTGKVTGVSQGTADITATDTESGKSGSDMVTVTGSGGVYTGEMVYIPAGSFDMGTPDNYTADHYNIEHPQHSVYLSGYYIGKYEVTRGEYRAFMNAGGYTNSSYWSTDGWSWKVSHNRTEPDYWADNQDWGDGTFTQTDNHPVVGVTYYEAEAFCTWAGGHLPTEAQWEKAARWTGSYPNVYPWGNTWDDEKCNSYFDSNPAGGGLFSLQTAPVGSYPSGASPSGCQDMAGNVMEWCKDWYGWNYYSLSPTSDPQGPESDSWGTRVLRGGSWGSYVNYGTNGTNTRCANRYYSSPYYDSYYYGFRLAR